MFFLNRSEEGAVAELASVGHDDWRRRAALRSHFIDVANPSGVAHVRTKDVRADTNHNASHVHKGTRASTQRRVAVSGDVGRERIITGGRVEGAGGVAKERVGPGGRVLVASGAIQERIDPGGRVVFTGGIGQERLEANGDIPVADNVGIQC
jgi:hypothetical protein